jgi:hypothetical protein
LLLTSKEYLATQQNQCDLRAFVNDVQGPPWRIRVESYHHASKTR